MMENNDDQKHFLSSKIISQELIYGSNEVIILDDDDFIQTTYSLFASNELNQEDEQFNNSCQNEDLLKQPNDLIDLTLNDDFNLYDMFMVNSGQNLDLNLNDKRFLKQEMTYNVKKEMELKTMTDLEEIPEIILVEDEVSMTVNNTPNSNLNVNSTEKKFTCPDCSKTFNKSFNYKRHLSLHKIKNDNLKKNSCPNCRKEIADQSNFIKHLKICSPDSIEKIKLKKIKKMDSKKEYDCMVCGKKFSKNFNLMRHLGVHFLNELNRSGNSQISLDDRLFNQQVKINLYECENCHRKFSTKQLLLDHKLKWHGTNYTCKYCKGVSFKEKIEFIRHLNLNHKFGFKFECKFCKISFPSINQYIQHNLTHLNKLEDNCFEKLNKILDNNRADCSSCINRNKVKNIQCLFCGKNFSKKFNLNRHLENKHSNKNDNQYQSNQLFSLRQKQFFEQNKPNFLINKI